MDTYYGKYRGTVTNVDDLEKRGRVQVSVPDVFGTGTQNWAEPCVPYAGRDVGLFAVPPVGAHVWVEFEAGDPSYPIVSGAYWLRGEVPGSGQPELKLWQTGAITVTLNDRQGERGLTIELRSTQVANGSSAANPEVKIELTAAGIELSMGASSVKLAAESVSINDSALVVS